MSLECLTWSMKEGRRLRWVEIYLKKGYPKYHHGLMFRWLVVKTLMIVQILCFVVIPLLLNYYLAWIQIIMVLIVQCDFSNACRCTSYALSNYFYFQLGAADYIAVAENFHTVFISDIPVMSMRIRDKVFISTNKLVSPNAVIIA